MPKTQYLFADGDLHRTLEAHRAKAIERVDSVDKDRFLNAPDDVLVDHVLANLSTEALTIHRDRMTMTQTEAKVSVPRQFRLRGGDSTISVPGVRVVVVVPFTGDAQLWGLQPNTHTSMYPQAYAFTGAGR